MHICVDSPIPTIDSILSSFESSLKFPPTIPGLPAIFPSLPYPLYPDLHVPNLELVTAAIELQAFQLQNTLLAMIKPMLSLLGQSLDHFLPDIPGLPGITLVDLIDGDPDVLMAAVKDAMLKGFKWPTVPNPLFPDLNIPSIAAVETLQLIIANYMQIISNLIPNLIGEVTHKLKIPNISGLPTLPDPAIVLSQIETAMIGKVGHMAEVLSSLSFPGMPALPLLPTPLVPSFNMPTIELTKGIAAFYNNLSTGLLIPIMTFINDVLAKHMGFTFPLICIDL